MFIQYITGFFLVFSGMLIGYWLWYRDQSESDSISRSLTRENEDLRTSLKLAHGSHEKLDERFTRQKGQLNVLQQLCDDWSSNREQSERERAQLEVEVSDKTRRYEEAMEELQKEKNLRISLEDENHRLAQEQLTAVSQLEDGWRQKHAKIESSLFQRQADLKSSASEKERLIQQLHAAESRVAGLQADLANQKSMLESATSNVSGLRQEYTGLESALTENSELLKLAKAECAAARSAQRVAEDGLAGLQEDYESAQQQIEMLQGKVANMESLESQVVSLQEAIKNGTVQIEKVAGQRDKALEAEKTALNRASGMQQRIENQEATIHSLRAKRDEALNNLQLELQKRNQVELQMEEKITGLELRLNEETVQMQNQATTFESQAQQLASQLEAERADWAKVSNSQEHDLAELQKNRDELDKQCEELRQEIQQLTVAIDSDRTDWAKLSNAQENDLIELRKKRDELSRECEELRQEIQQLTVASENDRTNWTSRLKSQEVTMTQLNDNRNQLRSELALIQQALLNSESDFKQHAQKESAWQQKLADQSTQIEEMVSIREGMKVELSETHQKLGDAETELADARLELNALREQIEELKTTCQRVLELEKLVQQRDSEESQVTEELRELRDQYADSYAKQQRLQDELERAQAEKHQLVTEYSAYDHQVDLLRNKLKASEETIRNLRRERAGVLARLANYRTIAEPDATVISFTEAMAQRKQQTLSYDKEYGGHVSQHATRGLVYTEAPESRDDLKRISGIAGVLEGRLNDYGIYTFKQIMEWKPEAIEEFSRLLAFKDRIERDEWLSQARFFYEEKQKLQRSVAA